MYNHSLPVNRRVAALRTSESSSKQSPLSGSNSDASLLSPLPTSAFTETDTDELPPPVPSAYGRPVGWNEFPVATDPSLFPAASEAEGRPWSGQGDSAPCIPRILMQPLVGGGFGVVTVEPRTADDASDLMFTGEKSLDYIEGVLKYGKQISDDTRDSYKQWCRTKGLAMNSRDSMSRFAAEEISAMNGQVKARFYVGNEHDVSSFWHEPTGSGPVN